MKKIRILIIQNRAMVTKSIELELVKAGYEVSSLVFSGEDIIPEAEIAKSDLVLMNIKLYENTDGIQTIKQIREKRDIPIIFIIPCDDSIALEKIKSIDLIGYIQEPFEFRELERTIEITLNQFDVRKQLEESEEKYKRNEANLLALIENTNDKIWSIDKEYKLITFNSALKYVLDPILGVELRKGINLIKCNPPEEQAKWLEYYDRALNGEKFSVEVNYKLNNTDVYDETSFNPIYNNGQIEGVSCVSRDITKRKQIEKKLKDSEEHFRSIYENAQVGIYQTTPDGKVIMANPAFIEMLEYNSLDELKGLDLEKDLYCKQLSLTRQQFKELIEEKGVVKGLEEILKTRNGKTIFVCENACAIKGEDGKVLYYEGTVEDITERKRAEELLQSSEKKYRELFEYANASVVIFEPTNEIVLEVNNKACLTYGFNLEEFIGMSLKKITKNVQRGEQQINQLLQVGYYRDFETTHFRKDGTEIDLLISSTVIDYNGKTAVLSINWDITEQQKVKTELIKAKEKAEEMNKLKTNFLTNMSHELRTPLIGIIGYADIIAAEADNEELKEMAMVIKNSGERLNETLNCILDLSRIESEQIEKNYEKINVNNFLTDCKNDFEDAASSKGLWINIVADTEPINVVLDKNLLKKITDNILSNAIKYTHKGGIVIKADYDKDKNKVEFVFADTGVGISKENLELIFDSFRQISEGFNRKFEGSGLGLSVTKKLVKLLGGKISIESELGKGSIFKVELPCNGKLNKCDNPAALSELSVPSGRDSSERSSR